MAEHSECGLFPIQGCLLDDTTPKLIQLDNNAKSVNLTGVVEPNKIITIYDDGFRKRLDDNKCDTLHSNYTLPSPSPIVSMYIKYNVTLFRCNHKLSTKLPPNYVKLGCNHSYEIYYDRNNTHPEQEEAARYFSGCSVVQFASKDSTDTNDVLSFVSAEMVIGIVLSRDCDDCFNHRGGLCKLDNNKHFYCQIDSVCEFWKAPLFRPVISSAQEELLPNQQSIKRYISPIIELLRKGSILTGPRPEPISPNATKLKLNGYAKP
ncbi:hypothetical protein PIB30_001972 [Stylosanthes scabra]|uniref:Uncharacterized protein n=1 Tax=Stylosanthes scabra TaxID=79078 RepID=A0ABU6Z237_9FABA|nr:hypothetical protein [Stylosanthes scabra]